MRNALAFSLAALLGFFMASAPASAQSRPASEFPLYVRLNGQPQKLGTIVVDGGLTTNGGTQHPFSVPSGGVLRVCCNGNACIGPGGNTSCSYAADAGTGEYVGSNQCRFYVLKSGETAFSAAPQTGGAVVSCSVALME
jgi:hypothetical protein